MLAFGKEKMANQLYTRYLPRSVLLSNLEWHGWILAKWYCHRNNGKCNALWESFTIFFSGQGRQYYVIQQVSKHSPEIRGLCPMTFFSSFFNFTYFYLINALVYVNLCNTFTVTCKQKYKKNVLTKIELMNMAYPIKANHTV